MAAIRLIFPSIAQGSNQDIKAASSDTKKEAPSHVAALPVALSDKDMKTIYMGADGKEVKSRIYSVPGFEVSFPDQNDVQLIAAAKWGVKPVPDST